MASDEQAAEPAGRSGPAAGNGPETLLVPATLGQVAFFADAGQRARDCQDGLIPVTRDTVLGVMMRERRASLDMRLVGREMDGPGKLAAAAGQVAAIWRESGGLQVVFCDIGLHGGPGEPWTIRGELVGQLSGSGIPADAIRFPGETPWPGAAAGLAAQCAEGRISVLIGSTRDLLRLPFSSGLVTAAHHLDAPYGPADGGPARRRGTTGAGRAARTMTFRYVTESGTDAARWQALDAGLDSATAALRVLTGRPAAPRGILQRSRTPAQAQPTSAAQMEFPAAGPPPDIVGQPLPGGASRPGRAGPAAPTTASAKPRR